MSRKRITADELSWTIFEQTRDELGAHSAISVAIVLNGADGGRTVSQAFAAFELGRGSSHLKIRKKLQAAYILKP
jgi:hypothetical protein